MWRIGLLQIPVIPQVADVPCLGMMILEA